MPKKIHIRFRRPLDPAPTPFALTVNPVTFTRTPASSPPPPPPPAGGPTWQIADASTLYATSGTGATVATGMQAGWTAQISPDPAPGQSLAINGSTLSLVSDSTTPTADIVRPYSIEVMDTPMARARNLRYPLVWWGEGQPNDNAGGLTGGHSLLANVLNAEYSPTPCVSGDTIEITPGAITQQGVAQPYPPDRFGGYLHVVTSCTIKNIDGRGRWSLFPRGQTGAISTEGIVLHRPGACRFGERTTVTIQGFEITNNGYNSSAIRLRRDSEVAGSYANTVVSLTLRNFKIGATAANTVMSGVSGGAEVMLMEDGYIYDCGDGSGQEHNIYVSARDMTLRGMRFGRTRGWPGAYWTGDSVIEGHILKVSAVTGLIEGCVIDCVLAGDQSELVQMKAGGNWTIRGNLFIDSAGPNNANGAILMCREYGTDGVTQNFEWWAGSLGNSILFERNTYIGHYPRPIIWFYPQASISAIRPSSWSVPAERLDSLIVRDNIGMVTSTPATWMLAGFPGSPSSERPMWINLDPNAGPNWAQRGNAVITYDATEAPFANRALKVYNRAAGPLAAGAGSITTKRWTWPHGYVARTDAYQGLG